MRRRASSRCIVVFGMVPLLLSCTQTLPAPEATAFQQLASADKDAFGSITDEDAALGLARAQRDLRTGGRVSTRLCASGEDGECTVSYSLANVAYDLRTPAPRTRALIASIARYSSSMADLAVAKDLDTAKTKAEAAAGSVKALANIAGPAAGGIVGAIVDLSVWAGNAALRDKRRRALLIVAQSAEKPIEVAADQLGLQSRLLRDDLIRGDGELIRYLRDGINKNQALEARLLPRRDLDDPNISESLRARVTALRDQRAADFATLARAATDLNSARAMKTDFSSLVTAHQKLIAKLKDPHVSLEDAMADIDTVLTNLDTIRGIVKS